MVNKNFSRSSSPQRIIRYAKNLQREIAEVIMKDIKDPGVNALTSVLDVSISKDFMVAYVKIRIFGADKKDIVKTLDALRRSSGYISSVIGSNLGLRRSPEIIFRPVKDIEYETLWLSNSLS